MASKRVLARTLDSLVYSMKDGCAPDPDILEAAKALLKAHYTLTEAETERMNQLILANKIAEEFGFPPVTFFMYEGIRITDPTKCECAEDLDNPAEYYADHLLYSPYVNRKDD